MSWNWLTGFANWLTGGEEKVPEELVFGAKLRCLQGSQDTYLIVNHTYKEIEGLPAACVLDRVEFDNIMPFGECRQNGYCRDLMKLRTRWDNDKPQDTLISGEEIITTESILICERCGGMIWAVNSGQDGKGAEWLTKDLTFLKMMMKKYPELLELMNDPNGSIYLTEGMYDTAMKFLTDCWLNNGCNMNLISLFDQSSPEGIMMRNVMERLLPGFDMSGIDKFRDDLMMKATENEYDHIRDWNVDRLNGTMFAMLRKECERTKKRMEEDPLYRWQEEHRSFMHTLSDAATILSYYVVANKGLGIKNGAGEQKVQQPKEGKGGSRSAQGLTGRDFENYLNDTLGGDGSFSVGGREFDGGVGNRWWEAKSGNYWDMLEDNPSMLAKFKSDMGNRLRIATDNGATYELFSNTPIPESIKQWLIERVFLLQSY